MKEITAILVDDEERARNVLRKLLGRLDTPINLLAECSDVPEAVEAINKHQPNVVFLDIQMPNYAGYELINFFDEIDFKIIFVTAYDEYAIRAFQLSSVDYLVKPVERIRLQEAVEKLRHQMDLERISVEYNILMDNMKKETTQKMIIPEQHKKHVVEVSDIIAIEGFGAYSCVYLIDERKITVSKNLKYFETNLEGSTFLFRTQKSWIVNLNHISEYAPNHLKLNMVNGIVAKVSKNKVTELKQLLEDMAL